MSATFAKLQLKDARSILVLNAPASFEGELGALQGVKIFRDLKSVKEVPFALVFVTSPEDLTAALEGVLARAVGDAGVWFAYPKGTSKRYKSTINRDAGWAALGDAGLEPVRMVAIDEDWSALRFRRAEYIKTLKRGPEHAMSKAGKAKASKARRT